jgi:BspA type Leucine rich repeat region (6 copies)
MNHTDSYFCSKRPVQSDPDKSSGAYFHLRHCGSIPAAPWTHYWSAHAARLLRLLLLILIPTGAQAQFDYAVVNGKITITGYTGPGGSVIIPDTINNLPVTSIGSVAFYAISNVMSVTISSNVANIEDGAFFECTGLTNVVMSSGVISIGEDAFYGSAFTDIAIPDTVSSIAPQAFVGCPKFVAIMVSADNPYYSSFGGILFNKSQTTLVEYPCGLNGSYTIPGSVTSVGDEAFLSCAVTNVIIPDSITSIGFYAFSGSSLSSITIGNGVGSIGIQAFNGCTNLTSITIPRNVNSIGADALGSCINLQAITVDPMNPNFASVEGVLFGKDLTTLLAYPGGLSGRYAIPRSVTTIASDAFAGCSVTSVMIPNSVTSIEDWAFSLCLGLTNLTIPSSVTNIGEYAFYICSNLHAIHFEGNAPSTDSTIFTGDSGIVYYLPGTTGWGAIYEGLPTAFWTLPHPVILENLADFGVQSNQFGFDISWATNGPVMVEAATDLLNPAWQPIQTNSLFNGVAYFRDPQTTNYPKRFYRVSPP